MSTVTSGAAVAIALTSAMTGGSCLVLFARHSSFGARVSAVRFGSDRPDPATQPPRVLAGAGLVVPGFPAVFILYEAALGAIAVFSGVPARRDAHACRGRRASTGAMLIMSTAPRYGRATRM